MDFESVARTHVGCRRQINEDAFLDRADLGLWAVADGVGGHGAGEVASGLVVDRLGRGATGEDLAARIAATEWSLANANRDLLALTAAGRAQRTISTTVVALLAGEGAFACLWAGDSRAYLWRSGALARLTKDHSLVQQLVDAGELDPEDASTHPNANVITRAVGASVALKADRIDGEARGGDVFLLASDGLTRLVSDAELARSLAANDLDAEADRLIETCLERGAPDNVTMVMIRVRSAMHGAAT
jgi:serine/threonine-protein phosphatase Stp1